MLVFGENIIFNRGTVAFQYHDTQVMEILITLLITVL